LFHNVATYANCSYYENVNTCNELQNEVTFCDQFENDKTSQLITYYILMCEKKVGCYISSYLYISSNMSSYVRPYNT